ncbi:GlcG/HbpS family heme-binding protein [Pseudomonas putida]|uniref:GlcG/HbpS family heme-binding protein n=1 Tax=Pseudomonas putida TaxID=303 RepID=UPI003D983EB7
MHELNLLTATTIAGNAIGVARESGFKPLAVAVLDAAGHPLVILRDERASFLRPQIATGKARGCLGMGFGGRELARRAQAVPAFFDAINSLTGGEVIPVAGGVLIRNDVGQILGAIGISGDTSDNDEHCAIQAIAQAGLMADNGDPAT